MDVTYKASPQGKNESEEMVFPIPAVYIQNESENRRDQNEKEHEVPMAGRLDKPDLKKYIRKNKTTNTMPYQSSFSDPRSNPNSGNNPSITCRDTNLPIALCKGIRK